MRTNTALLAKQAATIDHLSGGRLTLGLAVGGREDDYEVSGVDFKGRGKAFDAPAGGAPRGVVRRHRGARGRNGKRPGVLIGGSADAAYRRAAEHADGWTMGGGTPDMFKEGLGKLKDAWSTAGRDGEPRSMALFYFALGDDAKAVVQENIGDYYAFLGDYAQQIVDSAATDADMLKGYLAAFEEAGADDVICFPASPDPDQVELLAEAVL